ncbi:MbnP family protein [Croceibacter atlanticus]|uniref:MbnP family protein n=1 Tax=Croceibacter atlanticus TaxID=313588 RepID=UPI0023526209|nr:MbnP family protein [Croceibacter atlanticus]|tara:strand:- start:23620 stop:24390 length:771 start_codon:yes stop_codon:yes gene_type:complete
MKKLSILAIIALFFASCNTDEDANRNSELGNPTFGNVTFTFANEVDGEPLQLGSTTYVNSNNETYSVSDLKYIISNIVLINDNGLDYVVPEEDSYFIIDQQLSSSLTITLQDVPSRDYSGISFGFGVDQFKYPLNGVMNFVPRADEAGMLWSWSAGYRFLKFEGDYTTEENAEPTPFIVHVGSHGSTLDNYQEIIMPLSNFTVRDSETSAFGIKADISNIFDGNNNYYFQTNNEVTIDPVNAPIISDNMKTVFTIN